MPRKILYLYIIYQLTVCGWKWEGRGESKNQEGEVCSVAELRKEILNKIVYSRNRKYTSVGNQKVQNEFNYKITRALHKMS